MHLMYFTEQPMAAYDAKEGLNYGATALTFSNKHYDSVAGSRLYNEFLEEYIMADEWGVDGIMLNEHHNAPFCMQSRTNMFGAILAAVTKRAKIVFLGNPLPLSDNPVPLPKPEEAQKPAAATPAAASSGGGAGAQPTAPQATTKPAAPAPAANPPANPPAKP